jgi:hypothetical protein
MFHDGNGPTQTLTDYFQDLTHGLPVGFSLLDLSATSLVKTRQFRETYIHIRKQNALPCVLSDLTQLWRAVLCRGCRVQASPPRKYRCPSHSTEVFYPVFASGLAIGAVVGGPTLESEEQRDQVIDAAKRNVRPEGATTVTAVSAPLEIVPTSIPAIQSVCRGLAELTGSTFQEWCRADIRAVLGTVRISDFSE